MGHPTKVCERCELCDYSAQVTLNINLIDGGGEFTQTECRINPPQPTNGVSGRRDRVFPVVKDDDFCSKGSWED